MNKLLLLAAASSLTFAGCGSETRGAEEIPQTNQEMRSTPEPVAIPAPAAMEPEPVLVEPDANGEIIILVDDLMSYSVSRMQVRAGELVRIVLRHEGRLPVESMGHNIVFLKAGVDANAFALSAVTERDNGYLPLNSEASVLAASELIGGGQETVVEFTAPGPGTYTYVCTWPGHYLMMRGEMVVS